jgi:site-specific recombinase XerD
MKIRDEQFYKSIRDFLDIYLLKQKNYSPNTKRAYRIALSQFLDYLKEEHALLYSQTGFEQMNYDNICGYLSWLENTRHCGIQTVNQRLMAIRSFAKYVSIVDPAKIYLQVQLSSIPHKKEPLKVVEHLSGSILKCLFRQPDTSKFNGRRDQFFMLLMYDTAARCQELLDLKIGDIHLVKDAPFVILTGKGIKTRHVPISTKIVEHFTEYLNFFHPAPIRCDNDYVFYTVIHGINHRMSPDTVAAFMKVYAKRCKAICPETPDRVHPHLLRHSRAMSLYRHGMPLVLLSEFLGHVDVNTTRIYAWSDTEMKRAAIEKISTETENSIIPIWQNDEDMIKRLYGLS